MRYWGTDYDWRRAEAKLNALPQFVTRIDGLDIQFAHIKSRHPGAMPLLITHGWPGSIFELTKVIGPLTDPTAHGGRAEDAFDLVLPSMPGYGFSEKPQGTGWGPDRIARAWDVLMKRLGYTNYVSQGGDWGSVIASAMARQAPAGLLGIHVNMPATVPADVAKALNNGEPAPGGLTDVEKAAFNVARRPLQEGRRLRGDDGHAPADRGLRAGGFAGRPGRLDLRQVRGLDLYRRRAGASALQGRHARRHHALLADQQRHLVRAALLGEQQQQLQRREPEDRGHRHPGRRDGFPRRNLPGAAKLGPRRPIGT